MSKLKALIFDVDGTLADTERDGHRIAFNAAFDEFGLDWHWDVATYGRLLAVTGGKERMRHYADSDAGAGHILAQLGTPDDELIASLHQAKTRHYTDLLATGAIALRPGVERLLGEARAQGLRLGIATTTTPANVHALLTSTLGAASIGWFEVIAAGDVVPAKKPSADIYHYALEAMSLEASDCLAFEDSENGLRSSLGAGLATLVTVNGYTADHDFSGAALVCEHLGEPGLPCHAIAGVLDRSLVDLAALRAIHEARGRD